MIQVTVDFKPARPMSQSQGQTLARWTTGVHKTTDGLHRIVHAGEYRSVPSAIELVVEDLELLVDAEIIRVQAAVEQ